MTTKQLIDEVKRLSELANSTMTDIEYKAYKNSMVGKAKELEIALKEFGKEFGQVIFETKLWKRFYKIALKIFDKFEKR